MSSVFETDIARSVYYPRQIHQSDLFDIVRGTASYLGLPALDIRIWKPGLLTTWGSDAIIRESSLFTADMEPVREIDVGYFQRGEADEWTVRSFCLNGWVFSDQLAGSFCEELTKRGLQPGYLNWQMIGPVTFGHRDDWPTLWQNRAPRYQ